MIVMAAGETTIAGNKDEPRGVLGQHDRTALEQVDLRNKPESLSRSGFYSDDVDVLFLSDWISKADWGFLDTEIGPSYPFSAR